MRGRAYDLIAIGSGPAGQSAALQAARLGKRVAIVERDEVLGGVSTNAGTLPSKTFRAAVVEIAGMSHGVSRGAYRVRQELTIDDLLWRTEQVIEREREAIHDRLRASHIDLLPGTASFLGPHTLEIRSRERIDRISADRIVIAVGTTPARPPVVDFDDSTVLDSDGILRLRSIPQTLTVVGAGVIGLEYASMAAALGTQVTLVEKRTRILDFVDDDIVEALQYHLRGLGVVFRLGDEVAAVERVRGGAVTQLRSGEHVRSEVVIYAGGRDAATAELGLAAAGLQADGRGRIPVGNDYRTVQPHIFAAGDVIGFPRLTAAALEEGRLAALNAFGVQARLSARLLPFGIYTIPELSFVGLDEQALAAAATPYVVGLARYRDLTQGAIAGDRSGLLKLLVHADTRRLLGVHVFGTAATELVHIGQTVMAADLPLDYLVDTVFNVPTFADAYKLAALDAETRLNELGGELASAAA